MPETIVLGGGCFWCLEAVFDEMEGVESVESGYMGGQTPNPSYREVCGGDTGHAEVVRVTFDPARVTLGEILEVFFAIHDPTTLNRQGADIGTQYRSVIFYGDEGQRRAAEEAIGGLAVKAVTEVAAAGEFWMAEHYHQEYFAHNGGQPYCQMVVRPKVEKFRSKFGARRKK